MRRLLHHLGFAVVGFVFISSATASTQNQPRHTLIKSAALRAAGVPMQQERLTPDGRAILERGLNPDMLVPARPGFEGRLRPELLNHLGEPSAPEAEFTDRFECGFWQEEPGLLPGQEAKPSRGRLTLLSKALGPTGARTEVYYQQVWVDSVYETVAKQTYTWNDANQRTEELGQAWDSPTFRWVNSWRDIYAYDAAGNRTLEQYEWWDTGTGEKYYGYGNAYAYDAAGNRTESLRKSWDTATSAWVNDYRYTYTYDAAGNQTGSLSEYWDTTTSAWVNSVKYTYTCDAAGMLVEELRYYWDSSVETWELFSKYTHTYDAARNLTERLGNRWYSSTETWELYWKYTYTYDAAGNLVEYLDQMWDGSAWVVIWKDTSVYDAAGNRTLFQYEYWDSYTGEKMFGGKYTYTYDAAGNQTSYSYERWDTDTSAWVNSSRYTYTYDAAENQTGSLSEYWDTTTSAWVNSYKSTYTYDAAYTYPAYVRQAWDTATSAWVNDTRCTFIDDAENTKLPVPTMLSVADVPEDQGGKVRLSFERSRVDVPDPLDTLEVPQIVSYTMWRLIETDKWDALGAFNAVQDSLYYYVAPTINDSTRADGILWHTYRVSAHTPRPDVFFYSDTMGGYSVDNIPPDTVRGLVASLSDGQLHLSWDIVPDNDLGGYHLFEIIGDTYDPDQSLGFTATESFTFTLPGDDVDHTYVVAAEDVHGNLGGASDPVSLSSLGVDWLEALPTDLSLHQNYPNPFNPTTTIRFDLPMATDITIVVYDLAGREIARLADGHVEAGYHQVVWQGRTANGREVPTGIYIARMLVPDALGRGVTLEYTRTIKMVMMK